MAAVGMALMAGAAVVVGAKSLAERNRPTKREAFVRTRFRQNDNIYGSRINYTPANGRGVGTGAARKGTSAFPSDLVRQRELIRHAQHNRHNYPTLVQTGATTAEIDLGSTLLLRDHAPYHNTRVRAGESQVRSAPYVRPEDAWTRQTTDFGVLGKGAPHLARRPVSNENSTYALVGTRPLGIGYSVPTWAPTRLPVDRN